MRKLGEFGRRIWFLMNRRRFQRELREEIEGHRAAMSDPDRFGNSLRIREEALDPWGWHGVDAAFKDIRFSLRMIRKMPVVATVVVLSLGIGIGANTAIFAGIESLIVDPIPGVGESSSFLLIEPVDPAGDHAGGVSLPEYRDMRDSLSAFEELAAFRLAQVNISGADGSRRIFAAIVSNNYFSTLGLSAVRGRLDPTQTGTNEGPGIVVSEDFWEDRLGSTEGVVGYTVEVNRFPVPIVGVVGADFGGTVTGLDIDVWIASDLIEEVFPASAETQERTARGYTVTGKLIDGVTRTEAQEELDRFMARLSTDFPATNDGYTAEILSFWQAPRGGAQFVLPGLSLLQGVMIVLLLAVCGNTANLLLGRAMSREREMGIRMANGAGRWHIVRLLLIESAVLGAGGALLGIPLAVAATEAISAVRLSTLLPVSYQASIDGAGVLLSAGLGLLSALVFGTVPALHLAREGTLGLRTRAKSGPRATRRALVAVEAALAVLVLMAAGLFLEGFRQTLDTDPGFDPAGILLASYNVSGSAIGQEMAREESDPALLRSFTTRVLQSLEGLPEVDSAAIAAFVPLDIHGLPTTNFRIEGRAPVDPNGDQALMNVVTSGYFLTMRIPIVAGRDFQSVENAGSGPEEVIVNEEFVRRFIPSDPLGHIVVSRDRRFRIVGVAADAVYRSFSESTMPFVYYDYGANLRGAGQIHLRTRPGGEALLKPSVERVMRDIDPTLPLFDVRTMVEHVETNSFLRKIPAQMFAVLGPLLLVLAAVGIYSVVAYSVSGRLPEFAVRLALGANPDKLARGIVGECLFGIVVGIGIGWALAVVAYDHLSGGPYEPAVFVGVPVTMASVAAVAAWIPARKATRLDLPRVLHDD